VITSPSPPNGGFHPYAPNIREWRIGHISATGDPIHFMFGSRVGFSGMADRTALCTVRCYHHVEKLPYLHNRSSDPLHVWLQGGVFGDGGSNSAVFHSNKFKMVAATILDNFEWPYLCNGSRSTYIARIARSSLR